MKHSIQSIKQIVIGCEYLNHSAEMFCSNVNTYPNLLKDFRVNELAFQLRIESCANVFSQNYFQWNRFGVCERCIIARFDVYIWSELTFLKLVHLHSSNRVYGNRGM